MKLKEKSPEFYNATISIATEIGRVDVEVSFDDNMLTPRDELKAKMLETCNDLVDHFLAKLILRKSKNESRLILPLQYE